MTLAEILLFVGVVLGVYFALKPVRLRLEKWLLYRMGRDPGRKGQGPVFKINREDD
jgi:hypothetical protein